MTIDAPLTEAVVLVHGLYMSGWALTFWRSRLRDQGFLVESFSYESFNKNLSQNAHKLADFAATIPASRIHFVGHSLGGLLIVQMLAEHGNQRPGRVVLVGSPFTGSHVARLLGSHDIGKHMVGHSLHQWMTQETRTIEADWEIGVIAGSRSFGAGQLLPHLPEPNDGTVAVAETRMPGMRDHIVLNVSHTEMLMSGKVADQISAFLCNGKFEHAE